MMYTRIVLLATCAAAASAVAVRGVNLGGWLVLERYIKPSIMVDGFPTSAMAICPATCGRCPTH